MRAIFEKELPLFKNQTLLVKDDRAHHLNVARAKLGDQILVLDGRGKKAHGIIKSVSKKEVIIEINEVEEKNLDREIILFISVPKKDAFEEILKNAIECGVTQIYPLTTKFSQYVVEPSERLQKIIESALVQSNNLFSPLVHPQKSLNEVLKMPLELESTLLFTSFDRAKNSKNINLILNVKTWGIFIGPEAGFSSDEEQFIIDSALKAQAIHLPCPILRAPTAVAVSVGYILGISQNMIEATNKT